MLITAEFLLMTIKPVKDMDRGLEQLSVDFSTKAQKLFMSTYDKFRMSAKKLDRLRDENVFQMQLGKYLFTLRSELENVAHDLLMKNKTMKDIDHCNQFLANKISIYLREFRQKARSL